MKKIVGMAALSMFAVSAFAIEESPQVFEKVCLDNQQMKARAYNKKDEKVNVISSSIVKEKEQYQVKMVYSGQDSSTKINHSCTFEKINGKWILSAVSSSYGM